MRTVRIQGLKNYIKKCIKLRKPFNFLGFLENKTLSPDVESYFIFYGKGAFGYDWVNGNNKLNELILQLKNS